MQFTKAVLVSSLVLACTNVLAQGSITSGSAVYQIPASHFDDSPTVNFTGVGTGDQLFEAGWWFRIEGDAREFSFPAPTAQNYTGDTATITWDNLASRDLAVTKTHVITSAGAGQGETVTSLAVTNNAATAITLQLFHFVDFDVNGSATGDSATMVGSNHMRITDATAGQCEYRAPTASAYMVRPFSATSDVAALLSDTSVTNLDNSGLPFGPADFTGAFQWTLQLAAGASATVNVHLACNTAATPVSLQQFEID
ncbi:hypothetical protein [Dokdonella sp.]|uniref:hypothetical protein n=1 Tax=Dokdonella sp. TaxID=2291710 RepID=UPI0025B7ABD4|nr:hypothetical protein [Dokdonella sp.]MBX3693171.1 hypothetical protein [Dokdonella sp.]MCW5568225.1 hypothetical protein [Dokdonella sp.]